MNDIEIDELLEDLTEDEAIKLYIFLRARLGHKRNEVRNSA